MGIRQHLPVVLVCIFLIVNDSSICDVLFGHLYIFSGEMYVQIIFLSFSWIICLFIVELLKLLPYFDLGLIFTHKTGFFIDSV